ncbi:MAG: hypothetical protein L6V35_06665 [Alistipes putredinis]|nr:MAG: hypothetical protein L6V35_06665 [Alistipes putredinis]
MSVSAELEDEVAYVKRVEFGATDAGELVTVYLDAGSLTPVCEGGTVESLTITFPAGYELGLADTYKGKAALSKSAGSQTDNVFTMSGYTFCRVGAFENRTLHEICGTLALAYRRRLFDGE